jgi:hypothetical protein
MVVNPPYKFRIIPVQSSIMAFIDISRKDYISIEQLVNGLSDHDAQLLVIKSIFY